MSHIGLTSLGYVGGQTSSKFNCHAEYDVGFLLLVNSLVMVAWYPLVWHCGRDI